MGYMPNIIAGAFTSSEGFFVWTEDTLSVGEREAIIENISKVGGPFNKINVDNTSFFSTTEKIEEGINYRGTISINNENGKTILRFTDPSQWSQVYYGKYSKKDTINAEIEVINTYVENNTPVDLVKYGSSYDGNKLTGAVFSLYEGSMNEDSRTLTWNEMPMTNYETINVSDSSTPELSLPSGYYKLVETKAPTGYQLLDKNIYFKVEDGNVALINGNTGMVIDNEDMWEIDSTSGTITIKIQNKVIYDLPEAGGPGVYWYTLSGTLLMIGAALIVYRQKRKREVLLRK